MRIDLLKGEKLVPLAVSRASPSTGGGRRPRPDRLGGLRPTPIKPAPGPARGV